jgi:surfeit locus 1 family protein
MRVAMPNPDARRTMRSARRFAPRLVPTLATVAAVLVCVAAGNWQYDRMIGKENLRARYDAAQAAPPLPLASLVEASDWEALRYRTVVAEGEYLAAAQILIDNKVHEGRAGYHVVTPLKLRDGRTVLVDRGWIAPGATRAQLPAAPPPEGFVSVTGRVAVPGTSPPTLGDNVASGAVWQHLDPARFAQATRTAVLPVVIEATAASSAPSNPVANWPAPDFGIEKHRVYMVQWYAFAALALVLWVALNLRRERTSDG